MIECTTRDDGWIICVDESGVLINDDHPQFDCHTMGNLVCGPVAGDRTELARTGADGTTLGALAMAAVALIVVGQAITRAARR